MGIPTRRALFQQNTSIENLLNTQLVFFNIRHLAAMKPEIFQAQLYSVLPLLALSGVGLIVLRDLTERG